MDTLLEQIQNLDEFYALHFANLPRLTRDPEMLGHLIAQAEHLLNQLEALEANTKTTEVKERLEKQLALFCEERQNILDTLNKNPQSLRQATWLHLQCQAVVHRYYRHFAGYARSNRDLSLLNEMITDLENFQAEAVELFNHGEQAANDIVQYIQHHLQFFKSESKEILTARATGDAKQQAGLLGSAANTLFAWYQHHIANKLSLTRRPERLRRLIKELEAILTQMQALQTDWPNNQENIRIVKHSIEQWQKELKQIRQVREEASVAQLLQALNEEIEQILKEYNASDVPDVSTVKTLCDAADEVVKQAHMLCLLAKDKTTQMQYQLNHYSACDVLSLLMREFDTKAKAARPERTLQ